MRFTALTLLLAVATASGVTAGQAGARTKLSGVWTVDKTQGTLSARMNLSAGWHTDRMLTVEVNGDRIDVRIDGLPEGPYSRNFIVDGQPHSFPWGNAVPPEMRQSTVRWLSDADGFAGTEFGAKIRWTVSPDGQTLTIDTIWSNGGHDVYVYNRKNN